MPRFLFCTVLIFLTACTSFRKQADELFEGGDYFGATGMYERALNEDPQDAKAKAGLVRARRALIDERLIEVRQQRLADNFSGALNRLLWIVNMEAEWQVSPSGPAFSTQEEEVAQMFRWFHEQERADISAQRYLKAKIFSEKYQPIFAGGSTGNRYAALNKQIADGGATDCRILMKSSRTAFAREFATRYCGVWGVAEDKSVKVAPSGLPAFGRIEFVGGLADLPGDASGLLADSLLTSLKATPYYQPEGQALKVNLAGFYLSRYDEHQAMAVHAYTVQIPYTVTNTVPYEDKETYVEYVNVYDPITQSVRKVPHTRERSVTRYREETETRYRDEARSLPYVVTEFNLRYQLAGRADIALDGVPHTLPLEYQLQLTDRYHDTHNEAAGLYPRAKKMPVEIDWIRQQFTASGGRFGESLAQGWDTKYCQPKGLLVATQTETVMKCLKGTRAHHEFVENWFTNRFGLSYVEVQAALTGVRTGAQVARTY